MRKLRIEIGTENDAFAGVEGVEELARVIKNAHDHVLAHFDTAHIDELPLRDSNGNTVGKLSWVEA